MKWDQKKDIGPFSIGFYAEFRCESTIYITGPEPPNGQGGGKMLCLDVLRWVHAIFWRELFDFQKSLNRAHYFDVNTMLICAIRFKQSTFENGAVFCAEK